MDVEICIDQPGGAHLAARYGAKRVELCAALSEGGLTPTAGMIAACAEVSAIEVFVMIRPRAGGFVYTADELRIMEQNIHTAHEAGAKGVVFGALTPELTLDIKANVFLMEAAMKRGMGTTFHRAIDLCPDPVKALDDLINMGFDRVLTSGGLPKAEQGIETIKKLVVKADNRIEIMAGSGVNATNVKRFLTARVNAVHFTSHQQVHENLALDMGTRFLPDEAKINAVYQQLT